MPLAMGPFLDFSFSFNDAATTEIYTLSLHDALPISRRSRGAFSESAAPRRRLQPGRLASGWRRSEEHTSELQSHSDLVCRLLLEKKKKKYTGRWRVVEKNQESNRKPTVQPHTQTPLA